MKLNVKRTCRIGFAFFGILLLIIAFGKVRQATLLMCVVPLALFGGMLALNVRHMTLNVSSAVGFIALGELGEHLVQRVLPQRYGAGIVRLAVATESYPNDARGHTLEGIPCGIDADGGCVVDIFLAVDVCYMFHAVGGFYDAGEATAHGTVTHLAQAGGFDGGKSTVYAGATLFCQ